MPSPRQWWRRAAAAAKDKRSLYLVAASRHRNPEMEAAVIHATNHDDRSVDYKNAARVFAWARTSSSFVQPLMWALARRANRTRCWVVALKALMLAHGLLLRSGFQIGRLPFDLSDFRDRSSSPAKSFGFSSFVRAYFHFLDHRSLLSSPDDDDRDDLERIQRLQLLLDLLMQIRPYADGMEVGLILEAMDCVVIEIFDVYSEICNGIARFLLGILGSPNSSTPKNVEEDEATKRRRGLVGMRVLRKAAEQNSHLSSYFDLCRGLGVLNATELPTVERIPEEDIRDLERLVMGSEEEEVMEEEREVKVGEAVEKEEEEKEDVVGSSKTAVVTKEWVVFEDETRERRGRSGKDVSQGYSGNPFLYSVGESWPSVSWASMMSPTKGVALGNNGSYI
ncbi:putative clathrin assembly protein At1g25240 [Typha angustifolia]|uniref:putative clathrin assembly protein At1g25240 n=1 Tax=Typha angustifolia TaxID=59011 RepID=UPI003C2C67AA